MTGSENEELYRMDDDTFIKKEKGELHSVYREIVFADPHWIKKVKGIMQYEEASRIHNRIKDKL